MPRLRLQCPTWYSCWCKRCPSASTPPGDASPSTQLTLAALAVASEPSTTPMTLSAALEPFSELNVCSVEESVDSIVGKLPLLPQNWPPASIALRSTNPALSVYRIPAVDAVETSGPSRPPESENGPPRERTVSAF